MPAAAQPTPMWLERYPLADPEHIQDLEQRAAIHEFAHKLPRHEAEAKAHEDYRHDQLVEAAAHHLVGLRTAHAAGNTDQAKKHGVFYVMALKALGHDNAISPPDEVQTKAQHTPSEIYRFKPHKGDSLSIRSHQGDEPASKSVDLQKSAPVPATQITPVDAQPVERPVESRRYGQNGRVTSGSHAGKKNPYFNYDDYVPEQLRGKSNRPSGITIHQRGKEVVAQLNGGFGGISAFRRGDGGYALTHDELKSGHPIVQQYRQHVIKALADHLKAAHGAPYFLSGSDPIK